MAYRGRLAPSPTGLLHLGHARTFWIAHERCRVAGGTLIYRNDDLDGPRCRSEFAAAAMEDLRWLGCAWDEGPHDQSARLEIYRAAFERLRESGAIFPCACSRQDVMRALSAPHAGEDEPIYPGTCRGKSAHQVSGESNWRFRVPQGERVAFVDGRRGEQAAIAGVDFGDFVVWRRDGLPSYQLACAVDDAAMRITEVVRGADLITSTFRQLLLLRALSHEPPAYFHAPLVTDAQGRRLAKREDALAIRTLRAQGRTPQEARA